ncbi:reverse transcriptase domain-containing protein [Tanacetum coccineum]
MECRVRRLRRNTFISYAVTGSIPINRGLIQDIPTSLPPQPIGEATKASNLLRIPPGVQGRSHFTYFLYLIVQIRILNTEQSESTVKEYLTRVRDDSGPGIVRPLFEENIKFEFWGQCIDELKDNVFLGNNDENPLEHISNITSIVNLFQSPGVSRDQVMLMAFPLTYRPLSQIIRQTKAIRNFGQECNEPLHLAWERFNGLLYNCPQHKINEHKQLQIFYQGLNPGTRKKADFKEPIPRMTPAAGIKAIDELSKHSLSWYKEEEFKKNDFDKVLKHINDFEHNISVLNEEVLMVQHQYKTPNDERDSLLEETGKGSEASKIILNEQCSVVILNKVPPKEKDPGGFTISFIIGQSGITKALADLGASISLMPYSMFLQLNLDIIGLFVLDIIKEILPPNHANSIEPILDHLSTIHEDCNNPALFAANSNDEEKPTPKLKELPLST